LGATVGLALAYVGAGHLGLTLAHVQENATLVWPPTGLALAALVLGGGRLWLGVFAGALIVNLLVGPTTWPVTVAIAIGNTLEAVVGAALLARVRGFDRSLRRQRDVLWFLAIAVLGCTMVSATVGVVALSLAGASPWPAFGTVWSIWWLGDAGGALVVAPLVLAWASGAARAGESRPIELGVLVALVAATSLIAFVAPFGALPLMFLPFPIVVWAALRHGPRGATTASAVTSAAAIWSTAAGYGPFGALDASSGIASLWLLMSCVAVAAMLLGAGIAERDAAAEVTRLDRERLALALQAAEVRPWEWDLAADAIERPEGRLSRAAWEGAVHPEDRARVAAARDRIAAGESAAYESEHREGDASAFRWVAERGRAVGPAAPGGRALRVVGTVKDIDDQKRDEHRRELERERMERAQRLQSLGLLAGGVAHDFNNLLSVIRANLELIRRRTSAPERYLEDAAVATDRAARLCDQMLTYAGRQPVERAVTDLNTLSRELRGLLAVSMPPAAELDLELADALPPAELDQGRVHQVMLNLVLNAAESLPPHGGRVVLRTGRAACERSYLDGAFLPSSAPAGDYVYCEVEDTGSGMTPQVLEHLFDPFFTTKFTGRGLGMASVLGIVNAHRGAIKVVTAPGRGTRIRVLFPIGERVADAARPAPAADDVRARALAGQRVLVVDDEPAVRRVTAEVLCDAGAEVVLAASGAEAEQILGSDTALSCVVADLAMPDTSGLAVLARARALRPAVRTVLISGYPSASMDGSAAIDAFIGKPFRAAALVAAVAPAGEREPAVAPA
jgi:signal transduction histidine kinase/CheY-like chemotaxis protein